jgi:shikimate dehydrogenase
MTRPRAEVIGDPISHSKSPVIHRFWLNKLGIAADYDAIRVETTDLGTFLRERMRDPAWRGCNVTVPHKIAALDHVPDPGGLRDSIGAINTVFRDAATDAFIGTNTDAAGFLSPIADTDWRGRDAIVIGAGGAARAVLFALARVGIGSVTVVNRTPLKGAALLAQFGLKGVALPLDARLPPAQLLVNSSALGMTGQPPLPIDLAPLPEDALVYDIVYAPLETPLLAAAHARGLETVDGLEMLVGQAALAFELFFGVAPPREHDEELRGMLTA